MVIVELSICDCCPLHCGYCVAKTKQATKSNEYGEVNYRGAILPMEQTLNWLIGHFNPKECVVLITGGEPTIVPMGYEWSNRLVALGYETYVLTNGYKMRWEAARWNKAARYLVTHHIEQEPFDSFEINVKAMIAAGHKNITLQVVITPKMLEEKWAAPEHEKNPDFVRHFHNIKNDLEKFGLPYYLTGANKCCYKGEFYENHCEAYWFFEKPPKQACKNLRIWSVRPQGTVHVCHTSAAVGNIYNRMNVNQDINIKCYDEKTGFTYCQTENTILSMQGEG